MAEKIVQFIKKEPVLCGAAFLSAVTAFFVPPSKAWLSYFDLRVLALLLALMLTVAGLRSTGLFHYAGQRLTGSVKGTCGLLLVLTGLCFFSSMLVTNDVALITFVPFAITTLELAGRRRLLIPAVVLQTIAANLGSMLTPVGNPQNLYLYSYYELPAGRMILWMLPLTGLSLLLLALSVFCVTLWDNKRAALRSAGTQKQTTGEKVRTVNGQRQISDAVQTEESTLQNAKSSYRRSDRSCPNAYNNDCTIKARNDWHPNRRRFGAYLLMLLLCLLCVARLLPWQAMLPVTVLLALAADRRLFVKIDWCLLLTFVFFFLFIGNLQSFPQLADLLKPLLKKHTMEAGILSSQVISNVPAAVLLSGFTDDAQGLLYGVSIGGLGTLIASLASVISFRIYASDSGRPGAMQTADDGASPADTAVMQIADSSLQNAESRPPMSQPLGDPQPPHPRLGRYLLVFTIYNCIFLLLLYGAALKLV